MRHYPHDESDWKDARDLNPADWQLAALKMNPDYPHWGPHEDYMATRGEGWNSAQFFSSWSAFGPWGLDDYNEVVNFYFSIERNSRPCETCNETGQNLPTRLINYLWYRHQHDDALRCLMHAPEDVILPPDLLEFGRKIIASEHGWSSQLDQGDVDALVEGNRLWDLTRRAPAPHHPTAAEVNAWSRTGMGHDAINSWICIRARAERYGVYGQCDQCHGNGHIYTEPAAHLALTLWVLHPRKGASRGIEVTTIEEHELPAVVVYLRSAAQRNAVRFAGLPNED